MEQRDYAGIVTWISKVEEESNKRHEENLQRLSQLETGALHRGEQMDEILAGIKKISETMANARGALILIKMIAWAIGVLASMALVYGALVKGHP